MERLNQLIKKDLFEHIQHGCSEIPAEIYKIYKTLTLDFHWHQQAEIIYFLEGCGTFSFNSKEYLFREKDVFVLPTETFHGFSCNSESPATFIAILFNPEWLLSSMSLSAGNEEILSIFENQSLKAIKISEKNFYHQNIKTYVEEMFLLLKMNTEQTQGQKEMMFRAKLLEMTFYISKSDIYKDNEKIRVNTKLGEALKKVLFYIEENYCSSLQAEQIAKSIGYTHTYFCYQFKQFTKKTFTEYVNSIRVIKAIEKLFNSNASITDIALHSGFESIQYFARVFKKETGKTPKEYKKAKRLSIE